MNNLAKIALNIARNIQEDVPKRGKPGLEGELAESDQVIPEYLVKNTRGYIIKVVNQINGTYEHGWYDACAVMIRRLIEILIIEVFQSYGLLSEIKNKNGDFKELGELIVLLESRSEWSLEKPTRKVLPELKDGGNLSAHARKFNAPRSSIDDNIKSLRYAIVDLLYISKLKV